MRSVDVALSFCPNDTYLFYPWIQNKIDTDLLITPHFADIEQLNQWAFEKRYPLIKLSFACYSNIMKDYEILPLGAALGFGCGPKIVAKSPFEIDDLPNRTIAIPGEWTTAHFLLNRLLPPPQKKSFYLYHEIINTVKRGDVDCGVIIHESRFTYQNEGLVEIVDLGQLWHEETHSPLPLGGLAISRSFSSEIKSEIVATLRYSFDYAKNHPGQGLDLILHYSQEKDPMIVQKHITTYVTSESFSLSQEGIDAIELLLKHRAQEWLYV